MDVEPLERDGRAQVPGDYRLEEERVREMVRACFEEGILPTNIDPGEMEVSGREVKFTLNASLDEIKIRWLKERTVTVIFRDWARFLPKKVKKDVVRAYEDVWIRDDVFGEEFKRGRIKVESPNVVSYVPRAQEITDWMLQKKSDFIDLAGTMYRTEFKPWLTRAEIRDWRQLVDHNAFWVVAVGIPLDEMPFIHVHIEKAIGKVIKQHKPDANESDPKLVNLRFDVAPACKSNMKDKFSIQTCQGDILEVKLAGPESEWCKRCRSFFQTEDTCRRLGRRAQGGINNNQPQDSATGSRQPRPSYNGSLQAPGAASQPAVQPASTPLNVQQHPAIRMDPTFSPSRGQVQQHGVPLQGTGQGQTASVEAAWAAYFNSFPPPLGAGLQPGLGPMQYQMGMNPSMSNLHAFSPWVASVPVQGGISGNREATQMQQMVSPAGRNLPVASGSRVRGESPGKQQRVSEGDVDIQVDIQTENFGSSTGSQAAPSTAGKRKFSRLRMDALSKGQAIVESKVGNQNCDGSGFHPQCLSNFCRM
ncbi:hypothetical protein CBR_g39339 [Chara braunii]|uniref:Uncharacterized protein n=1 Tax=Chara braunii TaxID=69332 RepID=A0A388LRE0_CHABU|nr:hypothetical protein CBR_g39339 [Chara braunii]|eukprot:GBG84877.1 hypothetical protein CBR_g39339 [Chara braunii]